MQLKMELENDATILEDGNGNSLNANAKEDNLPIGLPALSVPPISKSAVNSAPAVPPAVHAQRNVSHVKRNTNQFEHMKKIVQSLFKHQYAWPFKVPVDSEKLSIPVSNLFGCCCDVIHHIGYTFGLGI